MSRGVPPVLSNVTDGSSAINDLIEEVVFVFHLFFALLFFSSKSRGRKAVCKIRRTCAAFRSRASDGCTDPTNKTKRLKRNTRIIIIIIIKHSNEMYKQTNKCIKERRPIQFHHSKPADCRVQTGSGLI